MPVFKKKKIAWCQCLLWYPGYQVPIYTATCGFWFVENILKQVGKMSCFQKKNIDSPNPAKHSMHVNGRASRLQHNIRDHDNTTSKYIYNVPDSMITSLSPTNKIYLVLRLGNPNTSAQISAISLSFCCIKYTDLY